MSEPDTDRLIRDAYGVVGRPDRLLELLDELQHVGKASAADLSSLQTHFERATELLNEIDPSIGDDFSSYTLGQGEAAPSPPDCALTLDGDLRVLDFDAGLFSPQDLTVAQIAPAWLWGYDREAQARFAKLVRENQESLSQLVRLHFNPDDESGALFAVSNDPDNSEQVIFRSLRLRWHKDSGNLFAKTLELTETERKLAQYIVNGASVTEFASDRNRSVGTARNQLKALLRKLGIGSQLDLVSLYAGFHSSYLESQIDPELDGSDDSGREFRTQGGDTLPYELYGDPAGTPVLYLHATAEGAYLTDRQIEAARNAGLTIIAPWLPFYAGTRFAERGLDVVEAFVDRCEELLTHLGVTRCPIITARVAAPYGFAAISRNPRLFCGLVAAGATLPADEMNDFSHLALGYRAPLRLARHAPGFVRLYFSAISTMVRRGNGEAYFRSIYGSSAADMATLKKPDVEDLMRRSLKRTFEGGYESTVQQTILAASDWSHWCKGVQVPVTLVCGTEDQLGPAPLMQAFSAKYGFTLVGPLDEVGSLAMQQVPDLIFSTARKIMSGA